MINSEDIYTQIKRSGNLPTLPEILLKLLEACDNEATPLSEVAAIISKDPALSFRVLQLVNSSYYGLRSTFTGVEQAVVYLGTNRIKNIAITTSIHQVFERKRFRASKHFKISRFWWNSLACATLARRIAQRILYPNPDEAYLSGLMHDIGRLILVSTFPKEHDSFLLEVEDVQNELWAEKQLIGITHCEAGAWLVNNWKLNSLMADAIRYHHESLERVKDAFPLVQIVYLANLLRENDEISEHENEAGKQLFGLGFSNLQEIVDGSVEEVVAIAENLNINVKPPTSKRNKQEKLDHENKNRNLTIDNVVDVVTDLNDSGYNEDKGQAVLASRIKSVALLSGFLENLVHAADIETIFAVFEQSMNVLFNINNVLFFLPDRDGVLLKGRTSIANDFNLLSQALVLPIQRSSSTIVKSYLNSSASYLTTDNTHNTIADGQVIAAFNCSTVYLVPIVANKQRVGVVLLGLPENIKALPFSDSQLIQVIAQQMGICLLLEDMQSRKTEEIEAERVAAVSMTARKFTHEINNPLGIITNYLATMRLKLEKESDLHEEIDIISEEIRRISSMVNQMDLFSQTVSYRLELTDINAVIDDIVQIVKEPLFAKSATVITFKPGKMLPNLLTSGDALKQVIINLIKNASEAMDNGGAVDIRTKVIQNRTSENNTTGKNGIEILIEDNGPGIPDSILTSLYKPFATTKKNGHSGLGLSIVNKIVKDLGGSISCTSKTNVGTCFSIFLPFETKAANSAVKKNEFHA